MSSFQFILFSLLCTYHILNICEAGSDDPWNLEQEEKFKGSLYGKSSTYYEQLCNRYAAWQKFSFAWDPNKLKNLSCNGSSMTLWSEEEKKDKKVTRYILICEFFDLDDNYNAAPKHRIGLSRGTNQNDAAEYAYDSVSQSWKPYQMLDDILNNLDN